MDSQNKVSSGDLKELGALLKNSPKDFIGVLRLTGKSRNRLYEADVLLQKGLVIAASRRHLSNNETIYGDAAYKEICEAVKKGTGSVELFSISELELKSLVKEQDYILLEDVKKVGELAGEEEKEERDGSDRDELEEEWDKLEHEWEKYDMKDKNLFDSMLSEDATDAKTKDAGASDLLDFELIKEEVKEELSHIEGPAVKKTAPLEVSDKTVLEETNEQKPEQIKEVIDVKPEPEQHEFPKQTGQPTPAEAVKEPPKETGQPKPPETAKEPPKQGEQQPQAQEKSSTEKFIEDKAKEIMNLKKNVEIYWGWDEKKKQFVGKEVPVPEKKPEPAPAQLSEQEKKDAGEVPNPLKKFGFRDKLFYLTAPKIIRVLERIDGKKSLSDISKETNIPINEVKYIIDQLKKDGYVAQ